MIKIELPCDKLKLKLKFEKKGKQQLLKNDKTNKNR